MVGGVSGVSVPNWESNGWESNGKPIMEPSGVSEVSVPSKEIK